MPGGDEVRVGGVGDADVDGVRTVRQIVAQGSDVDGDEVAVEHLGYGNPAQGSFVRLVYVALRGRADVNVRLPEFVASMTEKQIGLSKACDLFRRDVGLFVNLAQTRRSDILQFITFDVAADARPEVRVNGFVGGPLKEQNVVAVEEECYGHDSQAVERLHQGHLLCVGYVMSRMITKKVGFVRGVCSVADCEVGCLSLFGG